MKTIRAILITSAFVLFNQTAQAKIYVFSADLTAAQVVAGSTSTAVGSAVVTIDDSLYTVTTDLTWSGLTGPADRAHLHSGFVGQPSDEIFFHDVLYVAHSQDPQGPTIPCSWGTFGECVPPTGSSHDVLQLSANDGYGMDPTTGQIIWDFARMINAFETGDIYIDIHTEIYPEGEIRGQLKAVVPVPELSSWSMMLIAFSAIGYAAYHSKKWNVIT